MSDSLQPRVWTVPCQAPLSMEFSMQEYWSRFPFPSPGDLPDPGIKPRSPALQAESLQLEPPGNPVGKTIAFTIWTFVYKVMSLLFNTVSRLVIAFLPRSKSLLISWFQSPSTVIFEPKKIKSVTASAFSPSICHEVMEQERKYMKGKTECKCSLGSVYLYCILQSNI